MHLNRHLLLISFIYFCFAFFLFFLRATTVLAFVCPNNTVYDCNGQSDGTPCYLYYSGYYYCAGSDQCHNGNVENLVNACYSGVCSQYQIWDTHQTCQATPSPNPWTQCGPQSCGTADTPHCDSNCVGISSNHYVSVTFSGGGCSSATCQDFSYSCSDQGNAGCGNCGNPIPPAGTIPACRTTDGSVPDGNCGTTTYTANCTTSCSGDGKCYVQIAGSVKDSAGNGIQNVPTTVYDNTLGQTRNLNTDSGGAFWIDSFVREGDAYAVSAPAASTTSPVTFNTVNYIARSSDTNYSTIATANYESQTAAASAVKKADGSPNCKGYCNFGYTPAPASTFNFSMSNGGDQFVIAGGTKTNIITVNPISGSQTVTLIPPVNSSGITYALSSTNCPNASCSPTLTMTTSTSTLAGKYTVTVTGSGGSQTHTTQFNLSVQPPTAFDFSLSDLNPKTLTQGSSDTQPETVTWFQGTPAQVNLSVTGCPSGVTCTVTPTSCTPTASAPCSHTINMSTSSTASTGTATVTLTGTAPSGVSSPATVTHSKTFALTVVAAGTIALNAAPACSGTTSQIGLSWNTITGSSPYEIFRNGFLYYDINLTSSFSSFTDTVTPSSSYSYYIHPKTGSDSNIAAQTAFVCVTPTVSPHACISSPIGTADSSITINWNSANNPGVNWVDISPYLSFSPYYHKAVSGTSTTGPDGFNEYAGAGALTMSSGTPYFIRTWNSTSAQHSPPYSNYTIPACASVTPTPTPTPAPTAIPSSSSCPWIQTTGGDVHSNTKIDMSCP